MRVFVAGASGAIGRPLVQQLLAADHEVLGMTRSEAGMEAVRALGAEPVLADALDPTAVEQAIGQARPEVVIEQLTALPREYTPEAMRAAQAASNRVRTEGGTNVQRAASKAGARRYIVQSGCFFYAPGPGLAGEDEPFALEAAPSIAGSARVLLELEARVLGAREMEGVVLRYGFYCGPGTWYAEDGSMAATVRQGQFPVTGDGRGVWSFVHVEDAAAATVAAMTQGAPGVYNIADDDATPLAVWLPAYARWLGAPPPPQLEEAKVQDEEALFYALYRRGAANAKAKQELGFRPRRLEWLTSAPHSLSVA